MKTFHSLAVVAFLSCKLIASPEIPLRPGELDIRFGKDGKTILNGQRFLVLRTDQNIHVVTSTADDKKDTLRITRLQSNGTLDPNPTAVKKWDLPSGFRALTAVFQSDGKIILAGIYGVQNAIGLARYCPDGRLDPQFGKNGLVSIKLERSYDRVEKILIDRAQRILIVGNSYQGRDRGLVARLLANGSVDPSFGEKGITLVTGHPKLEQGFAFKNVSLDAKDRLLLAGYAFNYPDGYSMLVARLDPNGKLDESFAQKGTQIFNLHFDSLQFAEQVLESRVQGDLWVVGRGDARNLRGPVVVRLLANGNPDRTFAQNGVLWLTEGDAKTAGAYRAIELSDQKLLIGGNYPQGIAAFQLEKIGTLDPKFGVGGVTQIYLSGAWTELKQLEILGHRILAAGSSGNDTVLVRYGADR